MNFEDSFKIILKTYNYHLRTNPLLTKSVTSGILGFAGAAVAAKLRVRNIFKWLDTYYLFSGNPILLNWLHTYILYIIHKQKDLDRLGG